MYACTHTDVQTQQPLKMKYRMYVSAANEWTKNPNNPRNGINRTKGAN